MAFALRGSLGAVSTSAANSVTPAFGQATAAGNLCIAWVAALGSVGGSSIILPSGWNRPNSEAVGGATAAIFFKSNCSASETAPTFSVNGATSVQLIVAMLGEFTGGSTMTPASSNYLPGDKYANGVGQTGDATAWTITARQYVVGRNEDPSQNVNTGELVISCNAQFFSKAGTGTTAISFNNGTLLGNFNNDASSVQEHYHFAYSIATSNANPDQLSGTQASMNTQNMMSLGLSFLLANTTFRRSPRAHPRQAILQGGSHR